jgi:hypothetical protein
MWKRQFDALEDSELSSDTFGYYPSDSAVFPSKIEGEDIDLFSYIKYKRFQIEIQPTIPAKLMIYMMLMNSLNAMS